MTSGGGNVSVDEALGTIRTSRRPWIPRRNPQPALTDDEIKTENERLKLTQRRTIARVAGLAAVAQVVCADVVFVVYAARGVHWKIPTAAIDAWLAATVVQVIGIVLVITRSLFPTSNGTS